MKKITKEEQIYYEAMIMLVEADYEELAVLTTSEIARRLNVSRPYLSRIYKKYNYFTLHDDIEWFKFCRFESLIKWGITKTVKEAMKKLDIRSTSHFIKRYKAVCNKTPGQVKREIKKSNKKKENPTPKNDVFVTSPV